MDGTVFTVRHSVAVSNGLTSPQKIRGHISVLATLKFTFRINDKSFVKNNRGTSLIVDLFISYDR
jgi:hypothetical protein